MMFVRGSSAFKAGSTSFDIRNWAELLGAKNRNDRLDDLLSSYMSGGTPSAFTPDYAPEEMFEISSKLYKKSR
jgi:hypothetical protein